MSFAPWRSRSESEIRFHKWLVALHTWRQLDWAGLRLALVWVKQQQYKTIGVTGESVDFSKTSRIGQFQEKKFKTAMFRYMLNMHRNKYASLLFRRFGWLWNVGKLKKKISVYCLMVVKGFKLELH